MNIIRLAFINLKRYLKNPLIITFMLPLPIIIILFVCNGSPGVLNHNNDIAIVCSNATGKYEKALIEALEISNTEIFSHKEKPMELLEKNKISSVFILDENFSKNIEEGKKPKIQSFKVEDGGATSIIESKIESFLNTALKEQLLPQYNFTNMTVIQEFKENDSSSTLNVIIILICYFIFIGGTALATDILNLKKFNVLKRSMSTANKDYELLGGLCLAIFLIQTILFSISFLICILLLSIKNVNIFKSLIFIASMSFMSTSLLLFVTRIFKNEALVSMSLVVYAFLPFLFGMATIVDFIEIPTMILNISKFFPFYWCIDGIFNNNLFPNVFIILLMGICFFTAGNFRLKNFVND